MKKIRNIVLAILIVCMLVGTVPFYVSADVETAAVTVALEGNTGAVITASEKITSVSLDENLAAVTIEGNTAYVTAISDTQAIVPITVATASGKTQVEIPLGYTTFFFNGDTLTVYEGGDNKYEIAGINIADEEYLEDDANYTLPVKYDADGNAVYNNADNYSINVGIKKKGGSYVFYGESSDMSICVKKEATVSAELIIAGLELTSTFTSPITVKKDSTSSVDIVCPKGFVNTLTDCELNNEDLHGEEGTIDTVNPEYAESAVIKGKSAANITISGKGVLNVVSNSKNGIKVSEYGSLTVKDVTLNVTSVDHGISSDNKLTIDSGVINVVCEGDGIRSDPDTVDATAGASAEIRINGGNICIIAGSDGIQANELLSITGGQFCIKTGEGYNDPYFNSDTDSCKGLKVSVNTDESADTSECTCTLEISGGSFYLNCADDAVHSDAYINITGGVFVIFTGDDGVHADTLLEVGTENSTSAGPVINVQTSYEGLEAGTVNIYNGTIRVTASDDGINAAGGSDSTDNNMGFNPGGMRPGMGNQQTANTVSYSINVYGGDIIINANSDGFDSNGALNLLGGEIVVWGASSGDGEPLDRDGTMTINGATLLALGQRGTSGTTSSGTQKTISKSVSVRAGQRVNVLYNNSVVFSTPAVKSCSYVIFSSPQTTSTNGWSISSGADASNESCDHGYTVTAKIYANDSDLTNGGGYEEATYCGVCGEKISSVTVTAPTEGTETTVPDVTDESETTVPKTDNTETPSSEGGNSDSTEPSTGETNTTAPSESKTDPTEPSTGEANTTAPSEGETDSTEPSTENSSNSNEDRYLIGDVNQDGEVNVKDATAIQKHLSEIITLSEEQLILADADLSGKVNIKDATYIQKLISGLIEPMNPTEAATEQTAIELPFVSAQ